MTSQFRGVSRGKRKWAAQIYHDGKNRVLGYFDSETEAAKAYDRAARKHHKRPRLNFPDPPNTLGRVPLSKGVALVDPSLHDRVHGYRWSASPSGPVRNDGGRTIRMIEQLLTLGPGKRAYLLNGPNDLRMQSVQICLEEDYVPPRAPWKKSKTGHRGVRQTPGGRYQAVITCRGKHTYLGTFDTPDDAARAYDAAARVMHLERAITNF